MSQAAPSHAVTQRSLLTPSLIQSIPITTAVAKAVNRVRGVKPKFCSHMLALAIDEILEDPRFETAQWGIVVEPVAEPTVLYQHNRDRALIPASNTKLLTTAAAINLISNRVPEIPVPLNQQLIEVNRYSNNSEADALLRQVGGQRRVNQELMRLGLRPESYIQVDGSGLSRSNRMPPSTLITLLKAMKRHREGVVFYNSLPIAGVNGTLRNRFQNTRLHGKLHGKTGTLRGVRALSGYLDNADYGTIAFSILVNQPGQSGQVLTQAIDQIVLQMAQVNRCNLDS
ncbi:D-alanyl-D-alanine carboxypeptidase, putative (plasmid) [Acaryochloris marina MBIC11017]|uniref:D-alanyl-D-alanine carboxypeptidase, putative n=1 Tax=Acaryochloris marina (strain MBIC 11017) TaxID=329726 RepID=A8ZL72_ACAM1|nr:D-alanyl-D-alanine carboxypeptidase, putative [Acaryochloris marina MBIC11017]